MTASLPWTFQPEGITVSEQELSNDSSTITDEDEEILYHMKHMQLHNPRRVAKKLHKEGYKTMDQLVSLDFSELVRNLGIGAGDVPKLAQGLQHYQTGAFDNFYALPLENIVQVPETPTCVDIGVQERPSVEDASAQVEMAPPDLVDEQELAENADNQAQADAPIRVSLDKINKIVTCLSACGVPFVSIATMMMSKKCGDPLRRKFFDATSHGGLGIAAYSSLRTVHRVLTARTIPEALKGMAVGCIQVAGGVATIKASLAGCDFITGGCFSSSAQVLLSNRSHKSICDLREGDRILSFNKGVFRIKRVLRCIKSAGTTTMCLLRFCMPGGLSGSLVATPGHPIWVHGKGWCAVPGLGRGKEACTPRDVELDDMLVHHTGETVKVNAIELDAIKDQPFNLVVDGPGTFFVSEVLVHSHMDRSGRVHGRTSPKAFGGC
jgi:hypothetical protein